MIRLAIHMVTNTYSNT